MDRAAYLHQIKEHLKTAYLLTEERTDAMMPVFVNTLRGHMNRLAIMADDGDMEQLGRTCHAVKGALLNMGLIDLAQTAQQIEQQCQAPSPSPACREMIIDLQFTISQLCND